MSFGSVVRTRAKEGGAAELCPHVSTFAVPFSPNTLLAIPKFLNSGRFLYPNDRQLGRGSFRFSSTVQLFIRSWLSCFILPDPFHSVIGMG